MHTQMYVDTYIYITTHTHVHVCINLAPHGISSLFAVRLSSQAFPLTLQRYKKFLSGILFPFPTQVVFLYSDIGDLIL